MIIIFASLKPKEHLNSIISIQKNGQQESFWGLFKNTPKPLSLRKTKKIRSSANSGMLILVKNLLKFWSISFLFQLSERLDISNWNVFKPWFYRSQMKLNSLPNSFRKIFCWNFWLFNLKMKKSPNQILCNFYQKKLNHQ